MRWLPYVLGYLFAIFVGHVWPRWPLSDPLWERFGRKRDDADVNPEHDSLVGRVVGLVERPLYVAAFVAGEPTFVGIWLGIKVAGGWKYWAEPWDIPNGPKVSGRSTFNIMLIGSAVSVAYAWVGADLIRSWQRQDVASVILAPLALVAAHGALYWWLTRQPKWRKPAGREG
jgi:hypothetical protein